MTRKVWRTALIVAVSVGMAAGCDTDSGGDAPLSSDAGPGTGPTNLPTTELVADDTPAVGDSCSLLTPEDLLNATGHEFDGEPARSRDGSACQWDAGDVATVEVMVIRDEDAYRDHRERVAETTSKLQEVEIPGADEAFATDGGRVIGIRRTTTSCR